MDQKAKTNNKVGGSDKGCHGDENARGKQNNFADTINQVPHDWPEFWSLRLCTRVGEPLP